MLNGDKEKPGFMQGGAGWVCHKAQKAAIGRFVGRLG